MTDDEEMMPPPQMMMRDIKNFSSSSIGKNVSSASLDRKNVSSSSMGSLQLNALMATAMAAEQEDENAQSILEEHCSRIWDNSSSQTPSRSPGRSPDRGHRRIPLMGQTPNVAMMKKRKDKDTHLSTLSFDSGVGEDKSGVYVDQDGQNNKYVYHHHHHHHVGKESKSKQQQIMEYEREAQREAQRRGMTYYTSDPMMRGHSQSGHPEPHSGQTAWEEANTSTRGRSRDAKRSNAKKNSDSSSNIDSGVGLVYDISSPSKEK